MCALDLNLHCHLYKLTIIAYGLQHHRAGADFPDGRVDS